MKGRSLLQHHTLHMGGAKCYQLQKQNEKKNIYWYSSSSHSCLFCYCTKIKRAGKLIFFMEDFQEVFEDLDVLQQEKIRLLIPRGEIQVLQQHKDSKKVQINRETMKQTNK